MSELLKVKTRDFDEIEIPANEIITFVHGIFAFEEYSKYVLIAPLGENKFPMWLQSIENDNLCFIIFDPKEVCVDYNVTLTKDELTLLEAKDDPSVIEFLCIAVVPDKYEDTTINLKSPIAVNTKLNTAMQIIAPEGYPIRFSIFKKEDD